MANPTQFRSGPVVATRSHPLRSADLSSWRIDIRLPALGVDTTFNRHLPDSHVEWVVDALAATLTVAAEIVDRP